MHICVNVFTHLSQPLQAFQHIFREAYGHVGKRGLAFCCHGNPYLQPYALMFQSSHSCGGFPRLLSKHVLSSSPSICFRMTQHNPPSVGSRNYRTLLFKNMAAESDANTSQYVIYNRSVDTGACVAVGGAGSCQPQGLRGQ